MNSRKRMYIGSDRREKIKTRDELKRFINWSEVSRELTGSVQNIRKDKVPDSVPKKYKEKVNSLLDMLGYWLIRDK